MSAQELADLESLYADGVLDEDEYKTKLAELKPAKERTRADELADLEALRNDGILDDDEYKAKLAELQDEEPPAKNAKTEDEDYEQEFLPSPQSPPPLLDSAPVPQASASPQPGRKNADVRVAEGVN